MTQTYVPSVDSIICHSHEVTSLVSYTLPTYLWTHVFAAVDRFTGRARRYMDGAGDSILTGT